MTARPIAARSFEHPCFELYVGAGAPVKNVTASRICELVTNVIRVCPSYEVIVTIEQRRVAPCADVSSPCS
jgi:hypothetical protein